MKTFLSISLSLSLLVFAVSPVTAQIGSNSPEKLTQLTQTPVRTTQTTTAKTPAIDRSANVQTRAVNEINRRITSLNNVLTRINAMKGLSEETKTDITTQIQAEITSLGELKSQIEAETDETVIQELAQSVVTSYRVYAVFLPKMRTILAAEGIQTISEKMLLVHEQLATNVTSLETTGEDTTDMEQMLIDAEESIIAAQEDATSAIELVTPLSPDEYPGNRTVFQNARTLIRDARLSLVSARDSLMELYGMLKEAKSSQEGGASMEAETDQATPGATSQTDAIAPLAN
jgi:hypothetical protein